MVVVEDVSHEYMLGKVKVQALKDINLNIKPGSMVALVGPSGSGKTTLLNLIGSLDIPSSGSVIVDGKKLEALNKSQIQQYRKNIISFVFQSYNLFATLTLKENVEFPLTFSDLSKNQINQRVLEAIEMVGLSGMENRKITELSGGQRQRIAVARAIVTKSKIVLADEPTGNLDSKTAASVMDFFKSINKKTGTTFIFSTHDPRVVEYADTVIELADGMIVS